ncbi:hypothetical protein STEG23_009001 [Scotinomys teguina]
MKGRGMESEIPANRLGKSRNKAVTAETQSRRRIPEIFRNDKAPALVATWIVKSQEQYFNTPGQNRNTPRGEQPDQLSSEALPSKRSHKRVHVFACQTTGVIYVNSGTWKQPRCPSTEEWIRKMWYIYIMEYYAAEKNNDIMKFAGKWMELENVILSRSFTSIVWLPVLCLWSFCGSEPVSRFYMFSDKVRPSQGWNFDNTVTAANAITALLDGAEPEAAGESLLCHGCLPVSCWYLLALPRSLLAKESEAGNLQTLSHLSRNPRSEGQKQMTRKTEDSSQFSSPSAPLECGTSMKKPNRNTWEEVQPIAK